MYCMYVLNSSMYVHMYCMYVGTVCMYVCTVCTYNTVCTYVRMYVDCKSTDEDLLAYIHVH